MVGLTDRPDMTIAIYRGRETPTQQQQKQQQQQQPVLSNDPLLCKVAVKPEFVFSKRHISYNGKGYYC